MSTAPSSNGYRGLPGSDRGRYRNGRPDGNLREVDLIMNLRSVFKLTSPYLPWAFRKENMVRNISGAGLEASIHAVG